MGVSASAMAAVAASAESFQHLSAALASSVLSPVRRLLAGNPNDAAIWDKSFLSAQP